MCEDIVKGIEEKAKAKLKTNVGNTGLMKELSKEPYQKSDKAISEVPEKTFSYGIGFLYFVSVIK